jgi:hypothetical protein
MRSARCDARVVYSIKKEARSMNIHIMWNGKGVNELRGEENAMDGVDE